MKDANGRVRGWGHDELVGVCLGGNGRIIDRSC